MRDMLLNSELDDYIQNLSSGFNPVLKEMEEFGYSKDFPIIGPQVGRLIYQITRLKQPETIFELGSGFGYSTLWFALASPDNCRIHHTETDREYSDMADHFLAKAGVSGKVIYHVQGALQALRETGPGIFYDMIFCDIDKTGYPEAFSLSKKYLAPGGIFISDNILWHGLVADENTVDESAIAVREATKIFTGDKDYMSSIISVRDGVLVSIKK
jgi:predicted O-methyltransferase YrrM